MASSSPSTKFVEVPLQSSNDKFYNFFKSHAKLLPQVVGSIVSNIELTGSTTSCVAAKGSQRRVTIQAAVGVFENFKDEVEAVDDSGLSISYKVLEGQILRFYKTFKVELKLTNANSAKWTATYEKNEALVADPDLYLNLLRSASVAIDSYLLRA